VLVTGEAGIGKTRLVAELRSGAETRGCLVLQGACVESDRGLPYALVVDLLRTVTAGQLTESRAAWLLPDAPQFARILPDLIDEFPGVAPAAALEPDAEKRRLFRAISRLVSRIAADRPLLLVFEDLHWADDASLELLATLARDVTALPVLLLLTYRDEDAHSGLQRWLAGLDRQRVEEMTLQPLGLAAVETLLRMLLGLQRPVPAELLHFVYRLTEGNPFFVEEIARSLPAPATAAEPRGSVVVDTVPVPRTVQEAVRRRVDELDQVVGGVLDIAAVIGERFDFGLLQELGSYGDDALLACLKQLIDARLVLEISIEQFAFRHALIRQAVYAGLLGRERRFTHQRIAMVLERRAGPLLDAHAAELAYHFHAGGDWAKALEYAGRAAKRAHALHAPYAVIEQINRGLDAARHLDLPAPSLLLQLRGSAYELLGDFDQARHDYETALEAGRSARDRYQEWHALVSLGSLWTWRDYARAGDYHREALALARAGGDLSTVAHSLNYIGNWHLNLGQAMEALRHHREALSTFEDLDDRAALAATLDLLAMANYLGGDLLQGTEYCKRAIGAFRALDDRRALAESQATLALGAATMFTDTCVAALDLVEAVREVEQGLVLSQEIGWQAGEAFAQFNLAFCLASHYGSALAAAHASLEIAQEIEHHEWTTAALCVLGLLHRDLLALPTARAYLEGSLAQAQAIGSAHWLRLATGMLVSTLAEQRDVRRAEVLLDSALDPVDAPHGSSRLSTRLCDRVLSTPSPWTAFQVCTHRRSTTRDRTGVRARLSVRGC
jgi:tetratricopeptide (TPR) repeat protein